MSTKDVREVIHTFLEQNGYVRVADVTRKTRLSRAYIHRFLKQMTENGELVLVGKANQARYIPAKREHIRKAQRQILTAHRILRNQNLSEDRILDAIKRHSGIYERLPENVVRIVDYAFLEMVNNAIEHSRSPQIEVWMKRTKENVYFRVLDRGIGIFRNIMMQRQLNNEMEAIQDLLKGKQTTDPERHSGEGIFFTSKSADRLVIKGSKKKLIYDNLIDDIVVDDARIAEGTDVEFWISCRSTRNLQDVFAAYTGDAYEFGKTVVTVELFRTGGSYISRSQARRVLSGLEKFKEVVLDFKNVQAIGQGFADEVFRVWQSRHPHVHITLRHANENVMFMVKHVQAEYRSG